MLRLLISTKTVKERLEQEAVKIIQRFYRNWKARQEAWKKGEANMMQAMHNLSQLYYTCSLLW